MSSYKSGIEHIPPSDCGVPTEKRWSKFIIIESDLLKAVAENSIESTVRELCRKEYGNSPIFHSIVADIVHSICTSLALKMRDTLTYKDLCVIFDATRIKRAEEKLKDAQQAAIGLAYYIGESTPI